MTDLKTAAVWASELMTSLEEAGFSHEDALEIVVQKLPDPPEDEEDEP